LSTFLIKIIAFIIYNSDTLKKILSVVLKIKYDIENLTHNQNRMDNILSNIVLTNERSVLNNQEDSITINHDNDYSLMLPLHNEDVLIEFEKKIIKQIFQIECCKLFFMLVYI